MSDESIQYTTILIKRRVAGKSWTARVVTAGEIDFNKQDGKLYIGTQPSSVQI